ncbi:MAG: PAS domain S-box protein [Promethearchaeota archaeon]
MTEVEKTIDLTDVQFRTLFKNIPLPTYTWKKKRNDLILIDYNNAALKITKGYVKDFVGLKASEMYKDDKEILEDLNRCANEKIDISKDMKYVMRDTGKEKYLSVKYTFIPPNLVMVLTEDIKKRKKAENEILEIKEFYKDILDNILNGVWVANKDDIIFYTNKGMENIAGIATNQIISANVLKNFSESTLKYFRPYYNEVKDTLKPVYYDAIPIVTPAGRQSFQSGWLIPRIKDNKYHGIICTVEDVTHLKQTENQLKLLNEELELKIEKRTKKLKESEEKFRTITEQSLMGICIAQDNKIQYINKAYADIFGYTTDEMINWELKDGFNAIHPDDRDFVLEQLAKKQRGENDIVVQYQYRGIKKSGNLIWVNQYSKSILYKGKPADFITLIDITEKKEAEQRLKESEEKYRGIFEAIPDLFFLIRKDGTYLDYKGDPGLLYAPPDVFIGKTLFDILPKKEASLFFAAIQNTLETQNPKLLEYSLLIEDKINYFEARIFYFTDNQAALFIRDISDRKIAEKKLKESEEKYRTLINHIPGMVYRANPDWTVAFISNSKVISGYNEEDFISKKLNWINLVHPNDKEFILNEGSLMNEKAITLSQIYRIITKEGSIHWVNDRKTSFFDDKGNFGGVDGIVYNITDQKNAEEKLKESEEKSKEEAKKLEILNQIMKESHNAKDLSLLLENTLKSTLDLMNFDGGGIYLLKENMREAELVYHKGLPSDFIEKVKRINIDQSPRDIIFIKGQPIFTENYPKIDPQHSIKWGILSLASIPLFATDRVIGAINIASIKRHFFTKIEKEILHSIGRDLGTVVLKMQAEEKLKESEEKFRTIAEQSLIGIIIIQGRNVKYTNFANTMISGFTMKEILDWTIEDLFKTIHSDDLPLVKEQLRRGQKDDKDFIQYVCRIKTKYGKIKWVKFFSRNIIYQYKETVLVSIIDITEQKKAEQELINLSKLKSELLTRASHELKTPLISIKGYTELLLELYKEQFDNVMLSSLNQIKHGSERLEKTINNILNTSYLESEQVELDLKDEDLSFLIKYCVNEFQGLAKSRHHKISLHIQDNLITKFEKERVYEVLSNLIINAIKYTPSYGSIEINTKTKENFYIVSVKDNGIGFTEEEKERIFKQFGKIERYGYGWDLGIDGTGLGLYISKKIIELHGGEIWMESEGRNKGSTFYFSLPII